MRPPADLPISEGVDSPPPMTPPRVLICEDEGLTALYLRRTLRGLACDVVGECDTGRVAVAAARELRPDVILMDIHMPEMDGVEATRQIMSECPTVVVMLTAYSDREMVERSLAAGASGFLVKPISDEQLLPAITVAQTRFADLQQERRVVASLARKFASHAEATPGLEIAARYVPASAASRVGGDYFDFIELGRGKTGIVIGDACGSGLAAAEQAAIARHILGAYCVEDISPASVLERLNRALCQHMSDECPFVTLFYGVLDRQSRRLTYGNAGHPPPLLYSPEHADVRELTATGIISGAMPAMPYRQEEVLLPQGAVLTLFTDGIVEARQHGEMLGSSGVAAVVRENGTRPVEEIAAAILARACEAAGGTLNDDAAIVVLRHV